MKWLRTLVLFDKGNVIKSKDWQSLHENFVEAIRRIDHPRGANRLTIREKERDANGNWVRNGVGYLRNRFLEHLVEGGVWKAEGNVDLRRDRDQPAIRLYPSLKAHQEPITSNFGGFDFVATGPKGTRVSIEWETGNISSSHRSMNKMAIALGSGIIEIGVLIVPSRTLYDHLTDRVGNIGELSGYLSMWESLKVTVDRGLLAVSVVEHDLLTKNKDTPFLRVGNDGRAAQGRARTAKTSVESIVEGLPKSKLERGKGYKTTS